MATFELVFNLVQRIH